MSKNPNCYLCIHRRPIAGDAHSSCYHPDSCKHNSVFVLEIKGNRHGIDKGWFHWPFNYDPVWLDNCNGFAPKE